MKKQLKDLLDAFHKYNGEHLSSIVLGFNENITYDCLVVAPSFDPINLGFDNVKVLYKSSYLSTYEVNINDRLVAWLDVSASESNIIDNTILCSELKFKKMVFIGSAGSLLKEYNVGDICTPIYSIAQDNAHTFLTSFSPTYNGFDKIAPHCMDFIDSVINLEKENGRELKKASVFCTTSICSEYLYLDKIKEYKTDLIEMETATFYSLADLLEVDAIALLVISDNSATNDRLVNRSKEQLNVYNNAIKVVLPSILNDIFKLD